MRKSIIDEAMSYNEEIWVVSVINTGEKLFGHAAITVEGIKIGPAYPDSLKIFINHYDIRAQEYEQNNFRIFDKISNKKGYIHEITCDEEDKNKRHYKQKKYPGHSWMVSAIEAQKMIDAIHEDQKHTKKAVENQLRILDNKDPLYFDENGKPIGFLQYQRLGNDHPFVLLFGNTTAGQNCADWCDRKLKNHLGIDNGGMSKPKVSAHQCCIV